ncbi:hypothetical protein ACHAPT_000946 [Fusarium lateritium]
MADEQAGSQHAVHHRERISVEEVRSRAKEDEFRDTAVGVLSNKARKAIASRLRLMKRVSRHLGISPDRTDFDSETLDLRWDGKEQDLDWLTKDGTLKRLREEIDSGGRAKRAKLVIEGEEKPETDTETEARENGGSDKNAMDTILEQIRGLRNRADKWDDIEQYLASEPNPTRQALQKYSDALGRVLSHVDRTLTPSKGKEYTGDLYNFLRVILMVVGLLPSDKFKPNSYHQEDMVERCEALGPEARDAFKVLDRFQHDMLVPRLLNPMLAPYVATLGSLDCITKQRALHQSIKKFLRRGKGAI